MPSRQGVRTGVVGDLMLLLIGKRANCHLLARATSIKQQRASNESQKINIVFQCMSSRSSSSLGTHL